MLRALALLLITLATPVLAQPGDVAQRAISEFIRPGFADFSTTGAQLETEMMALCASPSDTALAVARDGFRAAILSFSRVEVIRFGPLVAENRLERLLFWPDRRGIALRQVQGVLGDKDETATNLATLTGKSVALQGFGPLEFVLYGTGAEELSTEAGDFRCRYGAAIAANIAAIAGDLAAEWNEPAGIAGHMLAPDAANSDYRTEAEVLEELTGALAHGLEALRDTRLLPVLGRDGAEPKPRSALLWRSGLTVPALRSGLDGLADLYRLSGIGATLPPDSAWVDEGIGFELANLSRGLDAITLPIEGALADPRQSRALGYVTTVTSSLQTQIGDNLSAALGLSVGFSSLDGD